MGSLVSQPWREDESAIWYTTSIDIHFETHSWRRAPTNNIRRQRGSAIFQAVTCCPTAPATSSISHLLFAAAARRGVALNVISQLKANSLDGYNTRNGQKLSPCPNLPQTKQKSVSFSYSNRAYDVSPFGRANFLRLLSGTRTSIFARTLIIR